jgi:DNA-binding transcriptional regulator YhcF (GntR family)
MNIKHDKIKRLWARGRVKHGDRLTYKQIAKLVKCSVTTVQRVITDMKKAASNN